MYSNYRGGGGGNISGTNQTIFNYFYSLGKFYYDIAEIMLAISSRMS